MNTGFNETTDKNGLLCYDIPKGDYVVVREEYDLKTRKITSVQYARPTPGSWSDDLETASGFTESQAWTLANTIGDCGVCNRIELMKSKGIVKG